MSTGKKLVGGLWTRQARSLVILFCLVVAVSVGTAGCGARGSSSSVGRPADLPAATATVRSGTAARGAITVGDARVVPARSGIPARAYLTIRNDGDAADVVTAVSSNVSAHVGLERRSSVGSTALATLPVSARETVTLSPGGIFVVLPGASRLFVGGTALVTVTFARAGVLEVFAPVVEPS